MALAAEGSLGAGRAASVEVATHDCVRGCARTVLGGREDGVLASESLDLGARAVARRLEGLLDESVGPRKAGKGAVIAPPRGVVLAYCSRRVRLQVNARGC